MLKTSFIKLSALAFAATVLSGSAVQASPIGLNVIPAATCQVYISRAPRNTIVIAKITTLNAGRGLSRFTVMSGKGAMAPRQKITMKFTTAANQPKRIGFLYINPDVSFISANVIAEWQGQEVRCSKVDRGLFQSPEFPIS